MALAPAVEIGRANVFLSSGLGGRPSRKQWQQRGLPYSHPKHLWKRSSNQLILYNM